MIVVRNAPAPEVGRLREKTLSAIERDHTTVLQDWLQDPETHVEDSEAKKKQTALIWAARSGSKSCMHLLINAGANINARMV